MSDARDRIESVRTGWKDNDPTDNEVVFVDALLAVLDLHKPVTYGDGTDTCWGCGFEMPWPCPTIRAINKALGGK